MGTPMAPLRLLYSFSDAGRAAKTLLSASSEEELQQLVMQYDAIQHTICEHSIRRSLGPCQQGIIAREAVEQKVAPVYDMVCWGCRERERKIKREAEQQRENEERRLRDERE